ncbi:MAG: protein kinase domain-containing protein [Wenzhouxiangella sp.]
MNKGAPFSRLTPARRRVLDRLLDQALERPVEDRAAYLEQCRRRAPRMARWLSRLLDMSTEPTGLLDGSARHLAAEALAEPPAANLPPLPPGTRLGPWQVIERVGQGGMGEVYRAERADGTFEMTVAIKLICRHADELASLLEEERRMMARVNHPAIARLIDGGLAPDRRPYLVMEWVEGQTLGDWFAEQPRSPEQALRLFQSVCEAVAVAHRALVLHGDIKPGNLAVSASGELKLLDFGVAHWLDEHGEGHRAAAVTPGFSAPEQAQGEALSTAADVYSLGALLRWMCEGRRTHQAECTHRPRDLTAIIARATATDPEQRYPTVNALKRDVQRLLSDEPVDARPIGQLARSWLWVRRQKLVAGLGAAAVACLLAGLAVAVWQAGIAAQERDVARHEAGVSLAVKDHLVLLFREVGSLSDNRGELTARELLDETAEAASAWLRDQPETRIEILLAIAEILISLEDFAAAEPLLVSIVDDPLVVADPVLAAKLSRNLAMVMHRRGDIEAGFAHADQAVQWIEGFPGDHRERLSDALQMRGRLQRDLGNWNEALADLVKARELARQSGDAPRPVLARSEANLAATYLVGGDFPAAARHMEAAEALWYALGRETSPDALSNQQNLAVVLDRLGRTDEAIQRFQQSIDTRLARQGQSGALGAAKQQYARLLIVHGEFDRAEELLTAASDMMARFVGSDSPDYAASLLITGELARARGRPEQAAALFTAAGDIFRGRLGENHPFSLFADMSLLLLEPASPSVDEQLAKALEQMEAFGPAGRSFIAQGLCERSVVLFDLGHYPKAADTARNCLASRQSLALDGWRLDEARLMQALAEQASGEPTHTEEAIRQLHAGLSELMTPAHARTVWFEQAMTQLGLLHD